MDTLPSFDVNQLFQETCKSGVEMLRSLVAEEWFNPTACSGWNVHDVALHIAGGLLANISRRRDAHPGNFQAFAPVETGVKAADAFGATLNAWNEAWVVAARRISPPVLIELIDMAGRDLEQYFRTLDLSAIGDAVGWAGPDPASVWLDVAREYTELWSHLAQIREASGRDLVDDPRLFAPVLETFMHAVPHTLRNIDRPSGTALMVAITGAAGGMWTVEQMAERWHLLPGPSTSREATVELDQVVVWRLATKGMSPLEASRHATLLGDRELGAGFLNVVAILG